jgi:hypothetical protein
MSKIPPSPFRKGGEEVFWDRLIFLEEVKKNKEM